MAEVPSAVILRPQKTQSLTVSIVSPAICHEVMGLDAIILVFEMLSFKPTFHSPLSLIYLITLGIYLFLLVQGRTLPLLKLWDNQK